MTAVHPSGPGNRRPLRQRLGTAGFHAGAGALAVLWLLPIALVVLTSLRSFDDIAAHGLGAWPRSFTFDGYRQAWTEGGEMRALVNSLLVTLPAVFLSLLLASMAAFALSRYRIPLRRTILLVMLAGNLLPPQILLIPVAKLSRGAGRLRHARRR